MNRNVVIIYSQLDYLTNQNRIRMSVLRRIEPKPKINNEIIINRRNQETIMMQIEEIEALRQSQRQKEMELSVLQKQNGSLENENEILLHMIKQQQAFINSLSE